MIKWTRTHIHEDYPLANEANQQIFGRKAAEYEKSAKIFIFLHYPSRRENDQRGEEIASGRRRRLNLKPASLSGVEM